MATTAPPKEPKAATTPTIEVPPNGLPTCTPYSPAGISASRASSVTAPASRRRSGPCRMAAGCSRSPTCTRRSNAFAVTRKSSSRHAARGQPAPRAGTARAEVLTATAEPERVQQLLLARYKIRTAS